MKQVTINKTSQFLVCELLTHHFLEKDDIYLFFLDKLLELGSPAPPVKPLHIPSRCPHWDCCCKARAWRAGVGLRLDLGGKLSVGDFLFLLAVAGATSLCLSSPHWHSACGEREGASTVLVGSPWGCSWDASSSVAADLTVACSIASASFAWTISLARTIEIRSAGDLPDHPPPQNPTILCDPHENQVRGR
jgi:hypothetical protein